MASGETGRATITYSLLIPLLVTMTMYTPHLLIKKAFDFVNRDILLYKLLLIRIDGNKVYQGVKSMFEQTSSYNKI